MRRTLFRSKIHRATVTQADLDYEGSVTIDVDLMRAADILPYEKVHIWNRTNGSRLETYALEGPAGSGVICVNGAAAHHSRPGDVVIIATFGEAADEAEARAVYERGIAACLRRGDSHAKGELEGALATVSE